ncbi:putative N-acetyltransferase YhbS, partial [Pseudocercospora fuligena]
MSTGRHLIRIRPEQSKDVPAIASLITMAYSNNTHLNHLALAPAISRLRSEDALPHSLVSTYACGQEEVVGHIAASPVLIDGQDQHWLGLGPLSVKPELQGQGIGTMLVDELLKAIREAGANGCVVAGRPKFYQRFGFKRDPNLKFAGAPASVFVALHISGSAMRG